MSQMPKLAIIDDNPDVLRFLRVALAGLHNLTCYASGRAALEGLLSAPPDVVLLDVDLGDMSGVEVARAIRGHARLGGVPIIAITSHDSASDRAKLSGEGFSAVVAKPIVDTAPLMALVNELLGLGAVPAGAPSESGDPRLAILQRAVRLALDALDAADVELARKTLRSALGDKH